MLYDDKEFTVIDKLHWLELDLNFLPLVKLVRKKKKKERICLEIQNWIALKISLTYHTCMS